MRLFRLFIFITALIGFGIQTQVQALPSIEWQPGPDIPATMAKGAAVLDPNDSILVIGGETPAGGEQVVWKSSGSGWTTAPDLDTLRIYPGVVRDIFQNILIYGGTGDGEASNEVLEYDSRFGDSQDVAKMNIPRRLFAFAADSLGSEYAIGGIDENGNVLSNVEHYDAVLDS